MILNKLIKHVILFISLFITTISFAQVQIQKGVSYRYNGKNPRTPLPNVVIEYDPERQPAISDSTGVFELTFSNRKMGDRIGLVTVTKREMMVFNQHAVDEWSVRKEPLCLVLCDADEFDRQKQEYIELGRKDARQKYDQQKKELEKQLEEGKIKQDDLENALNVAYERLEKLQKEIDKYADDLARIDMSELDDKMQEILEMYQCGETEEAIERLKSLKLSEEFDKETAHNEAVQQELQQSDSKLYTLVEQMKSSVVLLKNSGEWEEASKYLKRIADKTNNYDDIFAYAYFCTNQNNYQEAIEYYNHALQLIDENVDKDGSEFQYIRATLLNNLGGLYKDTQRFAESEAMYIEALEIYKRLAQANPQVYDLFVARTLRNLGYLFSNTQCFTESESMYIESLEIYRSMSRANPQAYEPGVAATLNNLGILYYSTQRIEESEAVFREALEIRRRLIQTNPQAYEPDLAETLNNLGILYYCTERLAESEVVFREALEIYKHLADANPQAYEPKVAGTLNGLGKMYKETQRFTESETIYIEALEIYRRLARANPQVYEPYVAIILNNFGNLYSETQRFTESEAMYIDALEILKRLTKANPRAYESDLAITLGFLGILYKDTQRLTESEAVYIESLKIYKRLAQANPQVYEPGLVAILSCLGNLYSETQRFTESEAVYIEDLEILKRLTKNNPQTYEPYLARTLYNIGSLHIKEEQYLKAIANFEDCLTIYRRLAQNDPVYGNLYLGSLYWLAQLYSIMEEHKKCYQINEERLLIMKGLYQEDAKSNQDEYVNILGSQSFQCIFVGQYEKAEQYAREALEIDSTQYWINTNLAAAMLFQGKYVEAEAVYCQYKNELKDSFLQDLQDFGTACVIPKKCRADVKKIKRMLNE